MKTKLARVISSAHVRNVHVTNLSVVAIVNGASLVNVVQLQIALECGHSMRIPLTGVDMTSTGMDQVRQAEVAYACSRSSPQQWVKQPVPFRSSPQQSYQIQQGEISLYRYLQQMQYTPNETVPFPESLNSKIYTKHNLMKIVTKLNFEAGKKSPCTIPAYRSTTVSPRQLKRATRSFSVMFPALNMHRVMSYSHLKTQCGVRIHNHNFSQMSDLLTAT